MSTTNILDLNNRIDALEKNSGGGGSADSAKRSDIATEFSATTAYTAGCFVYYEGKLYQFNADHAAGAWDPTDVVEANVTDQVVFNASAIAGLTASDVAYDNTTSGLTATDVQGAVDELAESYPANKVMMLDGASVEDSLASAVPRTATGTTLSTLNSAVGQLSETQKLNCMIVVNIPTFNSITLKKGLENYYICVYPSNGGSILTFMYNGLSLIMRTSTGTSKTDDTLSLTAWTLYYQGTPIS